MSQPDLERFRRWRKLALLLAPLLLALSAGPGAAQQPRAVWVVPIDTQITAATTQFVESRLARAAAEQPLAVVFEIDTPGGAIVAAEEIASAILNAPVPTVAVANQALSAGALIAMSAENLAMLPGGTIGAATAINGLTGETASEKINSVWRGQFRAVAEARGRNARVAEGMVSERVEIPGLSTREELVTLTAAQAVEYNIADLRADSLRDALAQLGYGDVTLETLAPSPWERFAGALSSPLLAAALLAVGVIGIAIEIFTPGFGIAGGVGVVALLLFFVGTFAASPPGLLDVVLLLGGVVLIAVELFVIPGFGAFGVLGLAALAWGIARIFQGDALTMLGYTTILGGAMLGLALWLLPNSRLARPLTLSARLAPASGEATLEVPHPLRDLLGQTGVALTDLRPAGVVEIDQRRVDVVSEGSYVARGSRVEVVRIEGNRVTVRAS
jgi:membrane-bound serine protease (ClpP class)